jgi:RNA polymerase sigma-70 factor (ECF subfamily)
MNTVSQPDTEELIELTARGDAQAREQLLVRHRKKLLKMVAVRLDRGVAARLDPSDVVQEAMAEAAQHLDEFLRTRPLPYYAWLRQFAWERLVKLHRHHIRSKKRCVTREEGSMPLPEDSVQRLARLVASGASPSQALIRNELRQRLRAALDQLAPDDREILVMRNLEQLSIAEIAEVLGLTEGAVKVRHLRALRRLRTILGPSWSSSTSSASRRGRRSIRASLPPSTRSTPRPCASCFPPCR